MSPVFYEDVRCFAVWREMWNWLRGLASLLPHTKVWTRKTVLILDLTALREDTAYYMRLGRDATSSPRAEF